MDFATMGVQALGAVTRCGACACWGVPSPPHARYGPIAREWETTRATRAGWLTRAAPYDNLPWADRALTIAELCAPGKAWGAAGPAYAMGPWASPPVSTVCAICIDDYDDVLPATGMLAPTAARAFRVHTRPMPRL